MDFGQLRMAFLWSMVVSLCLAAVVGLAAIVLPDYGPEEEVLASTSVFAVFSLLALVFAVVLEKRRVTHLMWAGMSTAGAALLVWLILIWFNRSMGWRVEEVWWRVCGALTVASIACAHAGLLVLPRFHDRPGNVVRWCTVGVAATLGVYLVALFLWWDAFDRAFDDDLLMRSIGVLSVLSACGTFVTPILWKVETVKRAGSVESIPSRVEVTIICPRCHDQQSLRSGPRRCGNCGLRITIDVEEPRCVCGYVLYRLESDRCPECGRQIRTDDAWAARAA